MIESCRNCKFWDEQRKDRDGLCRRYPRVPDPHWREDEWECGPDGLNDWLQWHHPAMSEEDWCGEWTLDGAKP